MGRQRPFQDNGTKSWKDKFAYPPFGARRGAFTLKTAVKFKQKDAKDTKSVTCEDPAQI
jgi:hypothetical protein